MWMAGIVLLEGSADGRRSKSTAYVLDLDLGFEFCEEGLPLLLQVRLSQVHKRTGLLLVFLSMIATCDLFNIGIAYFTGQDICGSARHT
jgi:hypothetical protein